MFPSTISVVSLSAITLPFQVALAITGVKSCIPSYLSHLSRWMPALASILVRRLNTRKRDSFQQSRMHCRARVERTLTDLVAIRGARLVLVGQHRNLGNVDPLGGIVRFGDNVHVVTLMTLYGVGIIDGIDPLACIIDKDRLCSAADALFYTGRVRSTAVVLGSAHRITDISRDLRGAHIRS